MHVYPQVPNCKQYLEFIKKNKKNTVNITVKKNKHCAYV